MTYLGYTETREKLKQFDAAAVRDLYSLAAFSRHLFFPATYVISSSWSKIITLSEDSLALMRDDSTLMKEYSRDELGWAFLIAFYHSGLFIDVTKCQTTEAERLLAEELRTRKVLLPFRFGRTLYDKFNDTAPPTVIEHLEQREAEQLLDGTPQGVYQTGLYVSGPLGILRSEEHRYTPPSYKLPLWHCSDTGCRALHNVELRNERARVKAAVDHIERIADDKYGPPSEWGGPLTELCRPYKHGVTRRYFDLVAVLTEAFVESEREALFANLLSSPSGAALRDLLAAAGGREFARGSVTQLTDRLDDPSRTQLMLCLADKALVSSIDKNILTKVISVPLYETRDASLVPPRFDADDLPTDVSVLGLRARHPRPIVQLTASIWDAYVANNSLEDLGWRLRKRTATPPRSALSDYLHRVTPVDALRELVLPDMPIAMFFSDRFNVDVSPDADSGRLIQRMLWKLGFNPPRYEQEYLQLRERLRQFRDTLLRVGAIENEPDREAIRGAGVNLFVSVEHFLEQLVSYNCWLLCTDHLLEDFEFSFAVSLSSPAILVGAEIVSGEAKFTWDASGGNPLGTLLVYVQRLAAWMRETDGLDKSKYARPIEDLPHFAESPEHVFRLRHTQIWADAEPDGWKSYVDAFESIVTQLGQANIAQVRNGLDHKRPEGQFPTIDTMLACIARIQEAFEIADGKRFLPKSYWLKDRRVDSAARFEYQCEDYLGRVVTLRGPSLLVPVKRPGFFNPVLIAPGDLLSDVGSELVFLIAEDSAFSAYWRNYPRRRKIPSPHVTSTEGAPSSKHQAIEPAQ